MGSVAYFGGQNSAPDGWLLCNGSAVSRTTYAALFSAIGTTYGIGDGSTTFNLPNLIDKFVEGSATAGTIKSAGLPNITGEYVQCGFPNVAITVAYKGALSGSAGGSSQLTALQGQGSSNNGYKISFAASSSNSIYGNSTTVQPPALTMRPFVYSGKTSLNKWKRTA